MKKTLLLLFTTATLLASNILNYDVYDRSNRVDVMFTFDTPYQGVIKETRENSKIILRLSDLSIQTAKVKNINSHFISKLTITPLQNYTQIVAYVTPGINLQVSKTADEYGLRLRFLPHTTAPTQNNILSKTGANNLSALPTQQGLGIPTNYYIVVSLLLIAVIFMFILKRKLDKKTDTKNSLKPQKNKWFFKEKTDAHDDNLSVRFTKKIDQTTNVMMIDYGDFNYLVLNGTSSVLLDKFENNKPVSKNNFDELLQEHTNEIEQLLHIQKEQEEPFQTYKEKASSIAYNLD